MGVKNDAQFDLIFYKEYKHLKDRQVGVRVTKALSRQAKRYNRQRFGDYPKERPKRKRRAGVLKKETS